MRSPGLVGLPGRSNKLVLLWLFAALGLMLMMRRRAIDRFR
jgi:hypothetical protein